MTELPPGLLGKAYAPAIFIIAAIILTLIAAVICSAPLWVVLSIGAPIALWVVYWLAFICIKQPTTGPQ